MMDVATYAWIVDGLVENLILWDGNEDPDRGGLIAPDGVTLVQVQDGQVPFIGLAAHLQADGSWTYDAPPPPPPPTTAQILATNTATRNSLLNAAAGAIAPLQDAVDLGEATAQETALLTKWKQFRVAVNRIDLTAVSPVWPSPPAALSYVESNPAA